MFDKKKKQHPLAVAFRMMGTVLGNTRAAIDRMRKEHEEEDYADTLAEELRIMCSGLLDSLGEAALAAEKMPEPQPLGMRALKKASPSKEQAPKPIAIKEYEDARDKVVRWVEDTADDVADAMETSSISDLKANVLAHLTQLKGRIANLRYNDIKKTG